MRSIHGLKRGYETVSGVNLSITGFCARLTSEMGVLSLVRNPRLRTAGKRALP